jgi:predicted dinucleotide-binding enzyme
MRIGVLGSGAVGRTIASKLAYRGHDVIISTRDRSKLTDWLDGAGSGARAGTLEETAAHGEMLFNCVAGMASVEALQSAAANLAGKILIDLANPLDFSRGMPPSLSVCNTDSLGERIQAALPDTHVVKTLNTVNAEVMVDPHKVANGDHHIFVSGNNDEAKTRVTEFLREAFGWKLIIDLGDITTARGTEMILPVWVRLWGALDTHLFNFKVVQ